MTALARLVLLSALCAAAGRIRLLADGKYSFRHYAGDAGIMSYGDCR